MPDFVTVRRGSTSIYTTLSTQFGVQQIGVSYDVGLCDGCLFTDRVLTNASVKSQNLQIVARWRGPDRYYVLDVSDGRYVMYKTVDGKRFEIGRCAEDVDMRRPVRSVLSTSGYVVKGVNMSRNAPCIVATDVEIMSGRFGVFYSTYPVLHVGDPATGGHAVHAVVEYEVDHENAVLSMPHEYIDICNIQLPSGYEYLYIECRIYRKLISSGLTETEIELMYGRRLRYVVDLASVSYGVVGYSRGATTALAVITGDNPYLKGAVEKHREYVKRRGLLVENAPGDLDGVKDLYMRSKQRIDDFDVDFDTFAYHVLGLEELEPLAVASYYERLADVDVELEVLERDVNYWLRRLDLSKLPRDVKSRARAKLVGVIKR